ncbi:MAG: metal ABC transporter substrate-binding protein [Armatimonadota bacterium]
MKIIIRSLLIICILGMTIAINPSAYASIDVVTATPELADIARQVGGDNVSVYSIAKPNHDYHMIEPRPSDVSRISRTDLVVRVGLDLDMWMDALLNAAGNGKVRKGASGYVDTSIGITKLEIPREQVSGASGDIHVYGNPHYFYDPENGKIIARNIMQGLSRVSPGNKAEFESNYRKFTAQVDSRMSDWKRELQPYKGQPVVTYHQSSIYFLRRFGLKPFDELEPKPGIPPTVPHIKSLIKRMKDSKVTAMVVDSIYSHKFPDLITRETGVKYVVTPYSVGSLGTKSYLDMIDLMVSKYKEALR